MSSFISEVPYHDLPGSCLLCTVRIYFFITMYAVSNLSSILKAL